MVKQRVDGHPRDSQTGSESRDGFSAHSVGLTAVDKALLRRFGDEGDDECVTVAGQTNAMSPLTPVVPATLHETALLIPHAQSSPITPPSGADTLLLPSRHADAACSTDNSHSTPPSIEISHPDGMTSAKHPEQGDDDGTVACESMDRYDTAAVKRRKVTGRYRMRAKKEVMDSSQPDDEREITSAELGRGLPDTGPAVQSVTQVEPCGAAGEDREAVGMRVEKTQMDDQVSEQRSVIAEESEGRNVIGADSRYGKMTDAVIPAHSGKKVIELCTALLHLGCRSSHAEWLSGPFSDP